MVFVDLEWCLHILIACVRVCVVIFTCIFLFPLDAMSVAF